MNTITQSPNLLDDNANNTTQKYPFKLLRTKDVKQITGLSINTINRHIEQGKFPPKIYLGSRTVWDAEEIDKWYQNLKAARDQNNSSKKPVKGAQ